MRTPNDKKKNMLYHGEGVSSQLLLWQPSKIFLFSLLCKNQVKCKYYMTDSLCCCLHAFTLFSVVCVNKACMKAKAAAECIQILTFTLSEILHLFLCREDQMQTLIFLPLPLSYLFFLSLHQPTLWVQTCKYNSLYSSDLEELDVTLENQTKLQVKTSPEIYL